MKKLILAGTTFVALLAASSALAADVAPLMPVKASIAPTWSWAGFYIGANVGGGWGSRDVNHAANDPAATAFFAAAVGGAPPSFKSSGALGGVQLGYNWQFNNRWLVGVETDLNWSGLDGDSSSAGTVLGVPVTATADENIKWFGTVRARLGYLSTDNLLTYVTGGFAYGRVEHTGRIVNNSATTGFGIGAGGISVSCNAGTACFAGSSSSMSTGWTAGAGFEYAIWKNVTFKAEYLYVSLGSDSVTETALAVDPFSPADARSSFNVNFSRTNFNVARVGLNYHF